MIYCFLTCFRHNIVEKPINWL